MAQFLPNYCETLDGADDMPQLDFEEALFDGQLMDMEGDDSLSLGWWDDNYGIPQQIEEGGDVQLFVFFNNQQEDQYQYDGESSASSSEDEYEGAQQSPGRKSKSWTCPKCHLPFRRRSWNKRHRKTHVNGKYKCTQPDCGVKFAKKQTLTKHVKMAHGIGQATQGPKMAYRCPECSELFCSTSVVNRHQREVHQGDFTCPFDTCHASYKSQGSLTKHRKKSMH